MPSTRHEGLVELIRQHPPLAVELVRLLGSFPLPEEVKAELGSEDMTVVAPPSVDPTAKPRKLTADCVVVVSDPTTGKRLLIIVIEPQGEAEDDKELSWPCYLVNARLANKCRAANLIVLCWEQAEADKCRRAIPTGQLGFDLIPWVVDRRDAPDLSKASPYLVLCFTLLRAIDVEADEGQRQVLNAIEHSGASRPDHRTLTRIILRLASDAARTRMKELMMAISFERDFIDDLVDEGIEKGIQQGIQQGREKGLAEAKAADIIKILDARGLHPTKEQRELVGSSTDLGQLDLWFDRALTAATTEEIFRK